MIAGLLFCAAHSGSTSDNGGGGGGSAILSKQNQVVEGRCFGCRASPDTRNRGVPASGREREKTEMPDSSALTTGGGKNNKKRLVMYFPPSLSQDHGVKWIILHCNRVNGLIASFTSASPKTRVTTVSRLLLLRSRAWKQRPLDRGAQGCCTGASWPSGGKITVSNQVRAFSVDGKWGKDATAGRRQLSALSRRHNEMAQFSGAESVGFLSLPSRLGPVRTLADLEVGIPLASLEATVQVSPVVSQCRFHRSP